MNLLDARKTLTDAGLPDAQADAIARVFGSNFDDNAATKRDLDLRAGELKREIEQKTGELKREIEQKTGELKREIEQKTGELKREIEQSAAELKVEIGLVDRKVEAVKNELKGDIYALETRMMRYLLTLGIAIIGATFAMLRLLK